MGENSLCVFNRKSELATYAHRNLESDMKDPLEEFFEFFKLIEDTKVGTNNEDNVTDYEDLDDSEFDKEENNNT